MTISKPVLHQVFMAVGIGIAFGCILGTFVIAGIALQPTVVALIVKSPTPTPTATPTNTNTPTMKPTATFTVTPSSTPTLMPSVTSAVMTNTIEPASTRTPRPIVQHFIMTRPVAVNASGNSPSRAYLYGTTRGGDLDVHHGEEFVNLEGTPLYAVADGTIVTAGSDVQPLCGDDGKSVCGRDLSVDYGGYYGKLVVLQFTREYNGQHIFALYGHMSKISVSKGDQIRQGDTLGEVGGSGVAQGAMHLHFEVRLGVNDYAHTRNPILWMVPLAGRGALAGRYNDPKGNIVSGAPLNVYRADGTFLFTTETYGRDRWPAVISDNDLGENFAVGDLTAGDYIVRIAGQQYANRFTIEAGKLTFVEIGGP